MKIKIKMCFFLEAILLFFESLQELLIEGGTIEQISLRSS